MVTSPRRYASGDEDSQRWDALALRSDDIVVSTRSKHGTTWVQYLLLSLILRRTRLPAPLVELSPWVDHLVEPLDAVIGRLDAQRHRRVLKTHTPLDGIPHDPSVTYVVVARHPLDAALSLYHHRANLDRERIRELTGRPGRPRRHRPPDDWLRAWIAYDADLADALDTVPGVMWHLSDAWRRRGDGNVVLVHYADLRADLPGEVARLATRLGIDSTDAERDAVASAAQLPAMRARARELAPDTSGVLRDPTAFFRAGASGEAAALLDDDDLATYHERAAQLAPPDLLAWLHRKGAPTHP